MATRSLSNPLLRAFAPSSPASSRLILFKAQSELSARRVLRFSSEAGLPLCNEISPALFLSSLSFSSKPDQLHLETVRNARPSSSSSFSFSHETQAAAVASKRCLVPEAVENVRFSASSSSFKSKGHPWLAGSSGMSSVYSLSASASTKPYQSCRLLHSQQLMEEDSDSGKEDVSDSIYNEEESTQSKIISSLPATKPGEKPRIVVLGTGWAASRLMKDLNTKLCDIVCISPRNHMVFTPLLASTCVGTLEFRSVAEPTARIQSALSKSPNSYFFLGRCTDIDPQKREVHCVAQENGSENRRVPMAFTVSYDKLVIAAGAQALTFNIKGVNENAIFLREVSDAQRIRRKLLLNLMLSDIPGTSEEEKRRLLHCVVVGGGPTGVEFSGELSDFIKRDVHQRYAHVQDYIHVTLIEAKEILSSFDVGLRLYAIKHLTKAGVKLVQGVVKDVQPGKLVLSDGSEVPYGLLVWSTGVGPSEFVKTLKLPKSRDGRIGVDEKLRVPGFVDMYAIGDCAGFVESVGKPVLPALAQVAERQGKYMAQELNRIIKNGGGHAGSTVIVEGPPFVYKHLGSMASVGRYKALVDLRQSKESRGYSWAGFLSWLVWRSAYLTRVVSWRNRFYVAVNWATTFVFGRDISRI